MAKKLGNSKLITGSDIVISLAPALKSSVEHLARRQHMTVTEIIEFALDRMFKEMKSEHWDENDGVRIVKMAMSYPELLTNHEKLAWQIISSDKTFWKDRCVPDFDKIVNDWKDISVRIAEARVQSATMNRIKKRLRSLDSRRSKKTA